LGSIIPNVAIIGNELEKRLNAIPSGKSISNETFMPTSRHK